MHISRVFGPLSLAIAAFVGGCSSSLTVTVSVKDATSGAPAVGIPVERYHPVSRTEKILNPVGAVYHPFRLAETNTTDTTGTVTFSDVGPKDSFQFSVRQSKALIIALDGREVRVSLETNQTSTVGWGCSVWVEDGKLRQSTWPLKE